MMKQSERIGENMITAAQEWFNEGVVKGQIEVIEKFLKAGATWDFIYNATDFDENSFHELKKKWRKQIKVSLRPSRKFSNPAVQDVLGLFFQIN